MRRLVSYPIENSIETKDQLKKKPGYPYTQMIVMDMLQLRIS